MEETNGTLNLLLEILNFGSKRDLVRHCKRVTIYQHDFVVLILGAQAGSFHPYKYANHYAEVVPEHLVPKEVERRTVETNGVGPFKTVEAKKFTKKLFQLFRERRVLAAHLLYTPDYRYWHIFHFDNRDRATHGNHWKFGAHIHYVCDLWTDLTMLQAWERITNGRASSSSDLHIRYSKK